VAGDVNLGLDGVTAEIRVDALDVNLASDSLNPTATLARLDWSRAFDLDGDGAYDDVLDPGAELPTPVDLSIDYPSSLQLRVRGSLTGTGSYTYDPEFRDELTDVDGDDITLTNVLLTFGDVKLAGTAEFALVTSSVTADVDGPGAAALLTNGQLTSLALTGRGLACT
jgi:hypothetical protein